MDMKCISMADLKGDTAQYAIRYSVQNGVLFEFLFPKMCFINITEADSELENMPSFPANHLRCSTSFRVMQPVE